MTTKREELMVAIYYRGALIIPSKNCFLIHYHGKEMGGSASVALARTLIDAAIEGGVIKEEKPS